MAGTAIALLGQLNDTPSYASLQRIQGIVTRVQYVHVSRSSPFLRVELAEPGGSAWWVQLPDLRFSVPELTTIAPGQEVEVPGSEPASALGRPILWAWEIRRGQDVLLPYAVRVAMHAEHDRRVTLLGKGLAAAGALALFAVGGFLLLSGER